MIVVIIMNTRKYDMEDRLPELTIKISEISKTLPKLSVR
jgi:hypothetical protein